ncbi:MAG: hypothetical protein Roseis2KO_55390 [Roseivirga sp.]
MQLKDHDYLEGLRNADNAVLRQLYDKFLPPVVRLVESNSGSRDDALDIFQEAVMVLYRKVKQADFQLTSALSTYIYAICRNHWMKRLNKKSFSEVSIQDDGVYKSDEDFIQEMEAQEKYRLFKNKMLKLGDDCRRILELFFNGTTMEKIANECNLSSIGYAKKRKFQCKEQLLSMIRADARFEELKYQ